MNNISCDPVFSLASADPWPLWGSQEVTFHLSYPKKNIIPEKAEVHSPGFPLSRERQKTMKRETPS